MGCNGWNHAFDCDCGWGGVNYSSTGGNFVNLSSSMSINLVGTKMAEFKQTVENDYSFNNCCDALLKMNMEISSSFINSNDCFEIKTVDYAITGLTKPWITVKRYNYLSLVIIGESTEWLAAKNIVESFVKHLEAKK